MTGDLIFCAGLVLLILGLAAFVVAARQPFPAVVGFVVFGLLVSIAWMCLAAPDVALTEAAIGGGVTGALLLVASAKLGDPSKRGQKMKLARGFHVLVILLCIAVSAGLIAVVLSLPERAPTLALVALDPLESTGVKNPVTAVLLAYRALDTLLETVVVLLAMVGVWSLAKDSDWAKKPAFGYSPERGGPLGLLASLLIPVGVMFCVYMVWTGSDHPGGKFQGAAILAAMGILGLVAGITSVPAVTNARLRWVLILGPTVFLVAGLMGFASAGYFLAWPPEFSKAVIVLIEVALTPSLALMLGLLVAGPPRHSSQL